MPKAATRDRSRIIAIGPKRLHLKVVQKLSCLERESVIFEVLDIMRRQKIL